MGQGSKCRIRNRMALLRTISIIFIITLCYSCNKDNGSGCVTRVGDIVTEERSFTEAFNTLDIRDNARVIIKEGPEYKAIVRGGANLMESYTTTVEGYKLVIENKTVCQWLRDQNTPFEVYITMPQIDSILFSGYGDISSDGVLEVDTFLFDSKNAVGNVDITFSGNYLKLIQHTGATNIHFTGSFDYAYVYSTSYSIIDLSKLSLNDAFLTNEGTGDFKVSCADYMKVKIDLTGNIYYDQDPEIFVESHLGSGQLIHY